jgi:anaerobic C4-dicarboxylate transporter
LDKKAIAEGVIQIKGFQWMSHKMVTLTVKNIQQHKETLIQPFKTLIESANQILLVKDLQLFQAQSVKLLINKLLLLLNKNFQLFLNVLTKI